MTAFKPAYLIFGDDHGRIAERRARLRGLAERESGAGGVEVLEGQAATPEVVAAALCTLTFAVGRRFLIVDGVERWRDREVEAALARTLADPPPETTIAFFAREEGRAKAPPALHRAVAACGGEVAEEAMVKAAQLPTWTREQARRLGLSLDTAAARALVGHVGERQQRLLRELEKLALTVEPQPSSADPTRVTMEDVEEAVPSSAERRIWTLADAVVARDGARAARVFLALRAQGERLAGLLYWMAQRLRLALEVAERLERGESEAVVRRSLRMPPRAAESLLADVRRSDRDGLRRAIEAMARLEVDSRGGASLQDDTAALLSLGAVAG